MKWLLIASIALVSLASHAQTPEDIQRLADQIVPADFRHLALTDPDAMIDGWVAHDIGQIRDRMIASGSDEAQVAALLEQSAASFRETIENDWYGRLDSWPNRDPRFGDLTDRDLLDLARAAAADGAVCDQAAYLTEFHGRNTRTRSAILAEAEAAQLACDG